MTHIQLVLNDTIQIFALKPKIVKYFHSSKKLKPLRIFSMFFLFFACKMLESKSDAQSLLRGQQVSISLTF